MLITVGLKFLHKTFVWLIETEPQIRRYTMLNAFGGVFRTVNIPLVCISRAVHTPAGCSSFHFKLILHSEVENLVHCFGSCMHMHTNQGAMICRAERAKTSFAFLWQWKRKLCYHLWKRNVVVSRHIKAIQSNTSIRERWFANNQLEKMGSSTKTVARRNHHYWYCMVQYNRMWRRATISIGIVKSSEQFSTQKYCKSDENCNHSH